MPVPGKLRPAHGLIGQPVPRPDWSPRPGPISPRALFQNEAARSVRARQRGWPACQLAMSTTYPVFSADPVDRILTFAALSAVLVTLAAYLFYLLVRPGFREKYLPCRADRPLWIGFTIISGTVWLLSSMHLSGAVTAYPRSPLSCIITKYWAQYTLGYIFWISCILYRMIRLYMVMAMVKYPLHSVAVSAILLGPFIVISLVASFANNMTLRIHDVQTFCHQGRVWEAVLHTASAAYFAVFLYLALRLRRVMGSFSDFRRYIWLCALSFFFFVIETATVVFRAWNHRRVRQTVLLLTLLVVLLHIWSLFFSIFVRKRQRPLQSSFRGALSAPPPAAKPDFPDSGNRARQRYGKHEGSLVAQFINRIFSSSAIDVSGEEEVQDEDEVARHDILARADTMVPPRGPEGREGVVFDFELFTRMLAVDDAAQIQQTCGYFQAARDRGPIREELVLRAFQYLNADPEFENIR